MVMPSARDDLATTGSEQRRDSASATFTLKVRLPIRL